MEARPSYVIIGNGITAVTAAEILHAHDATRALTIIADDPFPAYYRPGLKDFLGGRLAEEKLWARPSTFYQEKRIRFMRGRVVGIKQREHVVQLENGKLVPYRTLLLANGARPNSLSCPGLHLGGVSTLRTVADYQEILRRLNTVSRVVVSGSGTLALESVETLRHNGFHVTHLLRGKQLWSEVLDPVASDMVLQEERRDGVDVRTGEEIQEILGKDGQVCAVVTTRGERISCEMVLIAVGIEPITDFIRASGIACGRGVKVDDCMRTSSPDIYAAGDVIETTDALVGRTRVIGQWFPAIQQARIAAYHMLGEQVPDAAGQFYNATFLYGLDFASIGLTTAPASPHFQEVVAEPEQRNYRKAILYNGRLVGALLLGDRRQGLAFKRAIDHQADVRQIAGRLFHTDFELDTWLDQQHIPSSILSSFDGVADHAQISHLFPSSFLRALPPTPTLAWMGPDRVPHQLPLKQGEYYQLGRGQQNDLVIPDASLSRSHAEIVGAPDGFSIRDLNSRNGVIVNKAKINTAFRLSHGDLIVLGNILLYFSHPQSNVPQTQKRVAVGLEHRRETVPLKPAGVAFEIDMCIGCNRCMDACPLPSSSRITIAALNVANTTTRVAPEVASFTDECIMCGSCVPVCPVDNHRDLLMLSLKQRLGTSWESPPDSQRIVSALPAGWSQALFLQLLREQKMFRDPKLVSDTYLLHMMVLSETRILAPGEQLLREGAYGRDLYLILDGQLELTTTDQENREMLVAKLPRGEYVGEDGMLTGLPYKASVRAPMPTLLLRVPEQVMQRLMEHAPAVQKHFERFAYDHSLLSLLRRIQLFQGVADADLQELIRRTPIRNYERGEQLFAEDVRGRPQRETLHVLLEGFVKVARHDGTGQGSDGERIIAYRQEGDYFAGGLDLLGDGHAVTVAAINRCRVAEFPRQAVLAVFQRYPEVEQRFVWRMQDYLEGAATTRKLTIPVRSSQAHIPAVTSVDLGVQAGLHSLVDDGVVEGTEVLVIDLNKCIHCNECEEACERRHGHTRMNRKGMVIGNISITTTCRHCQDPVCMLCSRAGIARRPNGEVYITESCIGCGICAERCPYGAISIAEIDDEPQARSSWERFSTLMTRGAGKERARKTLPMVSATSAKPALPVVSADVAGGSHAASGPLDVFSPRSGYDELRKKIAIKCDLCAGYSNQACVQACPVGAAFRVRPSSFFGSTEEILLRQTK